jgi:hypothetical protein
MKEIVSHKDTKHHEDVHCYSVDLLTVLLSCTASREAELI